MKTPGFPLPAGCFLLAYALSMLSGVTFSTHAPLSTSPSVTSSFPATTSGNDGLAAQGPPETVGFRKLLPGGRQSLDGEIASLQSRPADEDRDEALSRRCAELLPTHPAAAFQVGMARWAFDREAQRAAAQALVRADPEAARGLLAECRDLRSRNLLESCLLASEVAASPREKLRWAEAELEGNIRQTAVLAGVRALVEQDPDAVLGFALDSAPSDLMVAVMRLGLEEKMKKDPAAAAAWLHKNVPHARQEELSLAIFQNYAAASPERARALLPDLPGEMGSSMLEAILGQATEGLDSAPEKYARGLELIHELPEKFRIPALRALISRNGAQDEGESLPLLLSDGGASGPAERGAIIESLMLQTMRKFENDLPPSQSILLSRLISPVDKATATRLVPYLPGLSEANRLTILEHLKQGAKRMGSNAPSASGRNP